MPYVPKMAVGTMNELVSSESKTYCPTVLCLWDRVGEEEEGTATRV